MTRIGGYGIACAVALVLAARPAYAYIDGGTASMIFQLMAGAAFALMFTAKMFWAQLKAFFASLFGKSSSLGK